MTSNLYRLLMEAIDDEEDNFEDNPNGEDNSETTDYTEEVEEISDQDNQSEDNEEASNPDESEDIDDTENHDDEIDKVHDDDTSNNEEDIQEESSSPTESKQRIMLIKDYMNLYEFINDMIEKLNSNTNINLIIQQVINRVNENLRQLREQLYDYITCEFKKDSYINSLTIYNYFIKAVKVNSEMIIKISQYDSKNEQNSKGKPMKTKVAAKNKK